jgi:hypothetical protein
VAFVDTNVLLDLAGADRTWATWSTEQLATAAVAAPLVINDVVFAEMSARFPSLAEARISQTRSNWSMR